MNEEELNKRIKIMNPDMKTWSFLIFHLFFDKWGGTPHLSLKL